MLITLTSRRIARIAALTQANAHGDACVTAAQLLRLDDIERRFARINAAHERLGYLSIELNAQRRAAYEDLLAQARKRLAPATYQSLYMAL